MARFFGSCLVGIPISFVFLIIMTGEFNDAFSFLALSIACTAGISLVIWIPVWWVLGRITIAVVKLSVELFGGTSVKQSAPSSTTARSNSQRMLCLAAYIRQAQATGMDAGECTRLLQLNGWKATEIEMARENITHDPFGKAAVTLSKP